MTNHLPFESGSTVNKEKVKTIDDIFIHDENGVRTDQLKPGYPKTFRGYYTAPDGEILEVYLIDTSKDWTLDISWIDDDPEGVTEIN